MIDRGLGSTAKNTTPCNDLSDHRSETNEIFVLFDTFTGENCRVYAGKRIQIYREVGQLDIFTR